MFKIATFLLLAIAASKCVNGGFWRRNIEENVDEHLEFAVRAISAGMNLQEQAEIDKRELAESTNKVLCSESCAVVQTVPTNCNGRGFLPSFGPPSSAEVANPGCQCISGYNCCPEKCAPAADKWVQCEKTKHIAIQRNDCCQCPQWSCIPCPKVDETCPNSCDQPVKEYDANGCPIYKCKKIKKPPAPKPGCTACERLRTKTDECGYQTYECECSMTPEMVKSQCTPSKPNDKDCYKLVKKNHEGITGCGDEGLCVQCYHWAYEPEAQSFTEAKCKPCEMAKVTKTTCGFKTECKCRTFENCYPTKPEPLACHTIQKVPSTDTSQCDVDSSCKACYTWKYVAKELTNENVNCDTRCSYKKPLSKECGSGAECQCVGKSKEFCQPEKPATNPSDCYVAKKVLTPSSFMCDPLSPNKPTCVQCWTWTFAKKECAVTKPADCSGGCKKKAIVHDACGCVKETCNPIELNNCQAAALPVNDCYTEPKKVYTKQKSFKSGSCVDCYYWNRTLIKFPPIDECKLRSLPNECFAPYSVVGNCNQKVKKCEKSVLGCEELYGGEGRKCPVGQKVIRLNNKCGEPRDACVTCGNVIGPQNLQFPTKCYKTETLTLHDVCQQSIFVKKQCDFSANLLTAECAEGQKYKIFMDDCNCPMLKCFGCPNDKKLDIALLLDSSGSMKNYWKDMVNEIKSEFIPSITTNKESRMSISMFGAQWKNIADLSSEVRGYSLDAYTDFVGMGGTMTANAMTKLLTHFKQLIKSGKLAQSSAEKILVVVTDGAASDKAQIPAIAEQLAKYAKILVIGFGNIDKAGLIQTANNVESNVFLMPNFGDFKTAMLRVLVPAVCGTESIPMFSGVGNGI